MTPEEIRQQIIRRERRIKLATVICILVFSLTVLLVIPGMLSSFLLAFVITFLFKPIVNYLERSGLNRTTSVLIPFLILTVVGILCSTVILPRITDQLASFQTEVPKYVNIVTDLMKKNSHKLNTILSQYSEVNISEKAVAWAQQNSSNFMSNLPNYVSNILTTMILAPFFAFFMLKDGRGFVYKLLSLVPNNLFELALNLQFQINQQMGGFVRARLLESALVGGIVWIGLLALGFPYAMFLGLVAGVTNIIPYIGPIIGALPAFVIALADDKSGFYIGIILAVYVLAQILDMLLVIPLVVAKIVDLHPVTVVVVIIIGGQVMGILGMIISIPVASIIKLTFTEFYHHVVDFRG